MRWPTWRTSSAARRHTLPARQWAGAGFLLAAISCLALLVAAAQDKDSGPAAKSAATPATKPTTLIPRGNCTTTECHTALKAMPLKHGPTGTGACDACHKELDPAKHTFELLRPGAQLCALCHQVDLSGACVHKPAADGQCTKCHNPHGGQVRYFMRAGNEAATCAACHGDVTANLPVLHGPVAAGECSACHRPHASPQPKLLPRAGRDLCLGCHATLQRRLSAVRNLHGPAAGDCTTCHRPHGAEYRMMLCGEPRQLCEGCHAPVAALIASSTVKHQAVSSGSACANCHDPHGSDHYALMLKDMADVCLACHDRPIEMPDGSRLSDMRAVLAAANPHGPVAQGNCAACHQVHGGSKFRLLAREYPAEFYAPFREENYDLCFACHQRQLASDPQTDQLTDFRNGDQNLHYVHVNRDNRGRTCRACHESHGTNQPKHIRDDISYGSGGWKMPIKFAKTETGGRCSPGCHQSFAYDRKTPVVNTPKTAP
jgi:predicted CXXCH cytochrome family protein